MAASLWRRLLRPSALHGTSEPSGPMFEADWSALSPAGLGMIFKELLAHLLGAPPPADLHKEFFSLGGQWRKNLNLEDIYFQRHFLEGVETGFLVRGVIFDMPALIQSSHSSRPVTPNRWTDWTTTVDLTSSQKIKDSDETVAATEVIERLGLQRVGGLKDRLATEKKAGHERTKSKVQEEQALEEVLGTGDSIRAKYMKKVQAKRLMAEARREQKKLGVTPPSGPRITGGGRNWQAMPGSPALLRYLEERGVSQALIARGDQGDLTFLIDQLGNYQFRQLIHMRLNPHDAGSGALLSKELFKSICSNWGLPAKQVMVVIGEGPKSDAVLRTVADSGFFVCRMSGGSDPVTPLESSSGHLEDMQADDEDSGFFQRGANQGEKSGLRSWFYRLSEGTLHKDDMVQNPKGGSQVHFNVSDMIELKWVIEDLNGTSYRRNTFLLGSDSASPKSKDLP